MQCWRNSPYCVNPWPTQDGRVRREWTDYDKGHHHLLSFHIYEKGNLTFGDHHPSIKTRPMAYHTLSSPSSLTRALWISLGTLRQPRFPGLPSLFSPRNHLSTPWLLTHHRTVESFPPDPRRRKRWVSGQFSSSSLAAIFPSNLSPVLRSTLLFWILSNLSGPHGWLRSLLMAAGEDSPLQSTLLSTLVFGIHYKLPKVSGLHQLPKWSFNTRYCSVVCPLSLWYVQYTFWFLREGSPPSYSEEQLVLDLVYDFVYWFLECHVHFPHLCFRFMHP